MSRRQAFVLFKLIETAFEMQLEKKFPISDSLLLEVSPVWESIAYAYEGSKDETV